MDIREIGFPANYYRGLEAVGGKIYFDDRGLNFIPHKVNFHKEEMRINFSEIRAAEPSKKLGIVPNGLTIYTKDDKQHKFVVGSSKKIAEYIRKNI